MIARKVDNRKDILLLLLYSPGRTGSPNEPIIGRTRLTKMLFLFREEALHDFRHGTEVSTDNFYCFFPWNFGPFSSEVYDDLTFFILRGFIQSSESQEPSLPESADEWDKWLSEVGEDMDEPSEYVEEEFTLTQKGVDFANTLYDGLSKNQKELLRLFKQKTSSVPLRALLHYVYKQYPDMIGKSTIKDEILGG